MQSGCFVRQGIKVGSAEEHNQIILIPQRVSQQVNTLSEAKLLPALRKLDLLQQISTFPSTSYRYSQTSIPGSLDLRLFPGGIQTFPFSPGKWNSISPVDSGSLSPAEYGRLSQALFKVIPLKGL